MADRWLKTVRILTTHPRRWLITGVVLTLALIVLLLTRTSVSTDVHSFFDPNRAALLTRVTSLFNIQPSLHVTIADADGGDILALPSLQEQDRLFTAIEERWPVQVDSLVSLVNDTIRREVGEQQALSVSELALQRTVDQFIFRLYRSDPYEFERAARKALSDQGAIDTLAELSYLASFGAADLAETERTPVNAVRATISLDPERIESVPAGGARQMFSEISTFATNYSDKLAVRLYSPELVGTDIDGRIIRNLPVVVAILLALLAFVLYKVFRAPFFVWAPIGVLVAMLVWAFGVTAVSGVSEWSFMTLVPIPLLLGQCIDNLIHFSERYREERAKADQTLALQTVLGTAGRAALLTTVINVSAFTVDGFLTKLEPVREYTLVVILGLSFAFILSYIFLPVTIALYKPRVSGQQSSKLNTRYLASLRFFDWLDNRKRVVVAVTVVAVLAMGAALTQVDTRYRPTSFMPPSSPVKEAYDFEQAHFLLYDPHYVLVEGNVASTEVLETVQSVESVLDGFEDVEHIQGRVNTESLTYLYGAYFGAEQPEHGTEILDELRSSQAVINPVRGQTAEDFFATVVHAEEGEYDATLITYWPALSDSDRIEEIADAVRAVLPAEGVTISPTGDFLVFSETMDGIVVTAAWAAAATTLIILLVLALMYRSVVAAAICVVPVLVATLFGLGMLPLLNIELNALNGTIAVLATGLGIDYAIQMMTRYREELRRRSDPRQAMRETFGRMAVPLGSAALLTSAGLFVLTGLLPLTGKFGIASGVALLSAYVAAVVILPILATRFVRHVR